MVTIAGSLTGPMQLKQHCAQKYLPTWPGKIDFRIRFPTGQRQDRSSTLVGELTRPGNKGRYRVEDRCGALQIGRDTDVDEWCRARTTP